MKVYRNPHVSREEYFVAEQPMRKYKNEASGTAGYIVDVENGEIKYVDRGAVYNQDLKEWPLVGSVPSIKKMIGAEVLKVVG